jgi:Pretoxin HINT domain
MEDRSLVPIENVRAGDLIASRNTVTGRLTLRRVRRAHKAHVPLTVKIGMSHGRTLIVSSRQPFMTMDGGRRRADEISVGTRLRSSANQVVVVTSVEIIRRDREVHWLDVDDSTGDATLFALDVELPVEKEFLKK